MNNEYLHQLPPEDLAVSDVLQSTAQFIQVNPQFQSNLETRLKQAHPENKQPVQGLHIKILPAIGWAILAIGALLLLNWAVHSLVPNGPPAANGTPGTDATFESNVDISKICTGQLAVAHGFSIFLSNPEKTGLVTLDEQKKIDELRTFSWSPDGQQLAMVGNTTGRGNIYLVDAEESRIRPVLPDSGLPYLRGVSWSRDGNRLLIWQGGESSILHFVDKSGTGLNQIDLPLQIFETPQFAPDNSSILFYGTDTSLSGLFQVIVESSQPRLISSLVEDESSFAWSQDGSRLAYIEMDRYLGEARLVVEGGGGQDVIASLPISKGAGSSIPNSANLSWSPDGRSLVFEFGRYASDRAVYRANVDGTGLVKLAESAHAPAISADGKCLAYISNQKVFMLDLANISSSATEATPVLLAELPAGRGSVDFQLDKLQWSPETIPALDIQNEVDAIQTPTGMEYDWRGIKLYLNAALPETPIEANLYQIQSEQPATVESARALAEQFGLNGDVYEMPSELGNSNIPNFVVKDGNQRLQVRSNLYFSFYPDYTRWATVNVSSQIPEQATAEAMIADFLRSHGFDFAYKVQSSGFYTGYYALPLTPDGFAIQHEHFNSAGLLFLFDQDGIIAVEANLIDYTLVKNFGIISAESALQKVLDPNPVYGILEGIHSANAPVQTWYRTRPEYQTISIWGWINSVKSVEGGAPLVTFDGYQATGNLAGLAESTPNTFVEATGQFQNVDSINTFNIEKWQVYNGYEDGLQGTIQRDGDRVTITTFDGVVLVLPNVPTDLPLPIENAFVLGVTRGDMFEWKSIDTRMQGGGGGGGGGDSGFYKPNLTGTPVPLPTQPIQQETNVGSGKYNVQEGDTLSAIADTYGTTVEQLMQINGLAEETIWIGQTLVIPDTQAEQSAESQRFENQRGTLVVNIYQQADGRQRFEYGFILFSETAGYNYYFLKGDILQSLQAYHNLPINIWGTSEYSDEVGSTFINVDRFEIPFPDLKFQIMKGTQKLVAVQGGKFTQFITEDGNPYIQLTPNGEPDKTIIGQAGDSVLQEVLIIPDETFGGYPAMRVYASSLIQQGESMPELSITADQPQVIPMEQHNPTDYSPPTATIELVELVYFTPNSRYKIPNQSAGPVVLQPVWRFSGHYSTGDEFEIMVQALKDEFLLPEIEAIEPPG